ncbi:MAG: SCO family protein [Xanthomonadales bacterium]|nr:SCO family protein [Xanthomonadales bacterium]
MPKFGWLVVLTCLWVPAVIHASAAATESPPTSFEYKTALAYSQDVIGKPLGEYQLTGLDGKAFSLTQLRGKPIVISLVFTSCYQICPMTTRHLAKVINKARDALGHDSFSIVTIGFDTPVDDVAAMQHFAVQQGIENSDWKVFSVSAEDVAALTRDLGFVYFPSARGFDHILQATVVDADGIIYRQVYGQAFETPQLVEPLKQLTLGHPQPADTMLSTLFNKIRFFCTTYDPIRDKYYFDYSMFVGIFIGAAIIILMILWIIRESLRRKRAI